MKQIIVYCFLFLNLSIHAQLRADAGDNLYLCSTNDSFELAPINILRGNTMLGGNPTAMGGIPPYKYKWECLIKTSLTSKPYIYASDLLNDTTISNPKLKYSYGLNDSYTKNKSIKFTLIVIDSLQNEVKDSMFIAQSSFVYIDDHDIGKMKNDTIGLYSNIGGGVYPVKFIWNPTIFLADTDKSTVRCFSPNDITYTSQIIDTLGCKSEISNHKIFVSYSNIKEVFSSLKISNFHNPITENSIFELNPNGSLSKIEIYNSLGQKIHSQRSADKLDIGTITKEKGTYFLVLYNNYNEKTDVYKLTKI